MITMIFIYYFLTYAGVTSQISGGTLNMNLNNAGEEYERFYIQEGEKDSAVWLSKSALPDSVIFADWYGWLRLQAFTKISRGIMTELYPGIMDVNGYVYATFANEVKGNARVIYGKSMVYNFPNEFLNSNKNLVYSNKSSAIYK